jgi:magnesium chelatase family protein
VSGPLIDRIDLGVEVPAQAPEVLAVGRAQCAADAGPDNPASAAVRASVAAARDRQAARQGKLNAHLDSREIGAHCVPDATGAELIAKAMARMSLSARAYHRILKVARTIADLSGVATIGGTHVAEAIGYRRFDRM